MGFEERMRARQLREASETVRREMEKTGSRETTGGQALDAIGRPLEAADGIFRIDLNGPPLFRVAGIQSVVDPSMPPGLVDVHVICFHTLRAKAGTPIPSIVRIGGAGELPPMPVAVTGTQPMPEEEETAGAVVGPTPVVES